jgi:N-acetylglucosamine kinase-like BadF-type ATPase
MRATAHAIDGRRPHTQLTEVVLGWLEIEDEADLLKRVHASDLTRAKVASLAPAILDLADSHDPAAIDILERGCDALGRCVGVVFDALFPASETPVFVIGGLANNAHFMTEFTAAVSRHASGAQFVEPALRPVLGAVRLALEEAGVGTSSEIDANLTAANRQLPHTF